MNPVVSRLTARFRKRIVVNGYSISRGDSVTTRCNVHGVPAILFFGGKRVISGRMNTINGPIFMRGIGGLLWTFGLAGWSCKAKEQFFAH